MMRNCAGAMLTAIALLGGAPAMAQTVNATNPQSVVAALDALGYQPRLETNEDAGPTIFFKAEDLNSALYFMNCDDHGAKCETVQFHARFTEPEITDFKDWNRTKRFARAFLDTDGEAVIEMDVISAPDGLSRAVFNNVVSYWIDVSLVFSGYVYPE